MTRTSRPTLGLVGLFALVGCRGDSSAAPSASAVVAPPATSVASSASAADDGARSVVHWGDAAVVFASAEQGRGVLGAEDDFTRALGPLDRSLRLGVTTDVADAAYRAHVAAQVIAWSDADRAKWREAAEKLAIALHGLDVPLPKAIAIVETTGKDEFDAAYTRGNTIVLPAREVAENASPLSLLAHELFHVATRHAPELRARLFPLLGFRAVDPVKWPPSLEAKRLTNPDAFVNAFAVRVHERGRGRAFLGMPLLTCAPPLAEAITLGLGKSIGLDLLELSDDGHVVQVNGAPLVHAVDQTDYLAVAAKNTGYAIHPEEVAADNFSLLVQVRAGTTPHVDDRAVLDAFEAALRAPR